MSTAADKAIGLTFEHHFTKPGAPLYDGIEFETRDAVITSSTGEVKFEQRGIEVPKSWSDSALNIDASKYFHGQLGTPARESSVKQPINRVVRKIVDTGLHFGYFDGPASAEAFEADLTFLLANQYAAFNSPVWFNVGCDEYEPENKSGSWSWHPNSAQVKYGEYGYQTPQCSACFINSVKDSMTSILDLAKTEGMLFKFGSGTGSNLSAIRGANEQLSGGGTASGPLSFMKGFDAFAGVIKSGGKTRRAAKMVILDADHPDIEEFIACKGKEEMKAQALMREGYDGNGPDSEAYSSVFFQNANNSVRVSDEFMQAAIEDRDWNLTARVDGRTVKTVKAKDLLRAIAEETWRCGDPGLQFDTTINKWNTSKVSGRINASNPCSEYMFLDDSACNLASFNLVKFYRDGKFNSIGLVAAVNIFITAMDILVDMSGYPTEAIAKNSHDYRPLGLGYANLGALLMMMGLPYDSDEGRRVAGAITALLGGASYRASAQLAATLPPLAGADVHNTSESGSFPGYQQNRESFLEVINMHLAEAQKLRQEPGAHSGIADLAEFVWIGARDLGEISGYRNGQVTVLAPTGTIGFLMDCDTTGIEPGIGVVAHKKLVGGGFMTIVNRAVPVALHNLGYNQEEVDSIVAHVEATGTVEGAAALKDEHLSVFDGAFKPQNGVRSIAWQGHVKMMAATQPFLSGAISKTVNLPNNASVDDILDAYVQSWKLGLKAVAIYRDGSKAAQPLSLSKEKNKSEETAVAATQPDSYGAPKAQRSRLPEERTAITHKFNVGGHEGYLTVGLYPDGRPGEIFIRMSKQGSLMSGLMDAFATNFSLALQHGVPLRTMTSKMAHMSFEPSGWTGNEQMGFAKSLMDYFGRWLDLRFGEGQQIPLFAPTAAPSDVSAGSTEEVFSAAPTCKTCGSFCKPTGTCWRCPACGEAASGGCS